ncbi:MAG: hypothetical protein MJ175_05305 [Clostridia bacterium]|nr:hypothetical protein [Clostridia bacterium]
MLYKKNQAETLSKELFEKPTSEYRCTPFWAWNCRLDQELLDREIDVMKEMGMGGFHMHSRTGMGTPYLTDEFMDLVRGCVEKARKEDMLAWLYDEDRWPSGAAGGLVTKDYRYRARSLCFSVKKRDNAGTLEDALTKGAPYLLAVFDIVLDTDGMLSSCDIIGAEDEAKGTKWYAYMTTAGNDPWYNGQSYVDTLSKEAIDKFISITHEGYAKAVGDEFDGVVPAIFTDEPQFSRKGTFNFATDKNDVTLPWTPDLPATFEAKYGYALIPHLPELFWELPDGKISVPRYHYHDHVCDRFTEAFADNCGQWCEDHNIKMTGHMMEEPTLLSQTSALGEAMRSYRKFGLPGIDMLCNHVELSTAKQCQSAVHQYGREGMLSELYGVTDWDFDFRGHKFQGDWQAALGVTVRVPHLFWVSMHGEAKRDYPAAIGYQSPWYKECSYVEDHFARVNTALTRGKPVVRVGVIHPVESYWLHFGPKFMTEAIRAQQEEHFSSLINWMLGGLVDFDFISESLLPEQVGEIGAKLPVGVMEYDTILVPELETMRRTTLEILKQFRAKGGKLIFVGKCPALLDAVPTDEVKALYDASEHANFDKNSILEALEEDRLIDIRIGTGVRTDNLLYQLREDSDCKWLFIAHSRDNQNNFITKPQGIRLYVKGEYTPVLYNTLNGNTEALSYTTENGFTVISRTIFSSDSLLIKLLPQALPSVSVPGITLQQIGAANFRSRVDYNLTEPNVLLLDTAEYKWDDEEEFRPADEILRLDNKVRAALGMPPRQGHIVQPWVFEPETPEHILTLRYVINSEIDCDGISLAIEDAEDLDIVFNGEPVEPYITGYFTDASIKTLPLPALKKGENELIVTMPFGRQTNTEWCYLLGEFGLRAAGCEKTITAPGDKIAFHTILSQGLPFYGGNIDYHTEIDVPEDCTVVVKAGAYRGAGIAVSFDGERAGMIVYEPYTLMIPDVKAGKHEITYTLLGTRFNCFGGVHNTNFEDKWAGPGFWRTGDRKDILGTVTISADSDGSGIYYPSDRWSDEYRLRDMGMLTAPIVFFMKKQ